MKRKEWREVGRQSLYFVLALALVPLLLAGLADLLQGKPLDGEKAAIMSGLWLLVFSLFMGLTPFAMDSSQKGMEYLLTLPLTRRRLLWIKFLPRLAAVSIIYLAYSFLYSRVGQEAFGGGFVFFSLVYFALFFISFSLSVADENFIVQSVMAGIALSLYLAACLSVVMLGFTWKFHVLAAQVGSAVWHDLSFDPPTLIAAIAVFLLLALPFVLSLFLAFDRYDLKPARAFNRRQLRLFVMLLLPAFALSLGITYLVQNRPPWWGTRVFLLGGQRALQAEFTGKLTLVDGSSRRTVTSQGEVFWERLLHEEDGRLFLGGYDLRGGANVLGRLDTAGLSWSLLHRCPDRALAGLREFGLVHDGEGFVYLRQGSGAAASARKPGSPPSAAMDLELVCLDLNGAVSRILPFRAAPPRRSGQLRFVGADRARGERFWLVADPAGSLVRIWQGGRVDDLGPCRGMLPVYTRGLLFGRGEGGLAVRRLGEPGLGDVAEIPGRFRLDFVYRTDAPGIPLDELYAVSAGRIVRLDPATLGVRDVGPDRGYIFMVAPGNFYYVEFESWPAGRTSDAWKKLHRLRDGRMVLLKEFAFGAAGYGHLMVERHGVVLSQHGAGTGSSAVSKRYFSFPALEEVRPAGAE